MKCGPLARCLVEMETTAFENITLATIAPPAHPMTCDGQVGRSILPLEATERSVDEGDHRVEVSPEIGPNIKMMAKRPVAVAAAFSKSCKPTLPDDRFCAAMPEPTTTGRHKKNDPKNFSEQPSPQTRCRS